MDFAIAWDEIDEEGDEKGGRATFDRAFSTPS